MPELSYNATIVKREDFHPTLSIFHIKLNDQPTPGFDPGQFVQLALPVAVPRQTGPDPRDAGVDPGKWIRRSYSIASAPREREAMQFFIVRVDEGQLTPRLWNLRENDPVYMSPKVQGHFTLDPTPADKNILAIATGTGIAPFISMLRQFKGARRWNRFTLIHGVRHSPDLGYVAEMEALMREDPDFRYVPSATREPADAPFSGLRGRIPALYENGRLLDRIGFDLRPDTAHVYMCGNPDMILDLQKRLETERGFKRHTKREPGSLHYERYW